MLKRLIDKLLIKVFSLRLTELPNQGQNLTPQSCEAILLYLQGTLTPFLA